VFGSYTGAFIGFVDWKNRHSCASVIVMGCQTGVREVGYAIMLPRAEGTEGFPSGAG
jgi:hypothetical protein